MSQQKQEDKEPPFVPQYFGTQQPKRNVKPRPMPAPGDLEPLRELFRHQIESFDYMADAGLSILFDSIKPVQIHDSFSNRTLKISFENPKLFPPMKDRSSSSSALSSSKSTFREFLYPYECRQFKSSYTGALMAEVCFQYDDGPVIRERFNFGQFPIMLKSKYCHLRGADPQKLVSCKEEPSEMGGYFILNGLERVVRLLILPKRNYPMSMVRNSFSDRREGYTDKAVVIRCERKNQSSVSVKLYYLRNGSARLGFWIQGREYLLPVGVVLKALVDTTDHEIYVSLTCCYSERDEMEKGAVGTQLMGERAKIILDEVRDLSLFTRLQCLEHIGEHFQPVMEGLETKSYSDVADSVLEDYIFVHLDNNYDKFNLLIFMLQKLFSLIDQTSVPDNSDSLQNQEVLLPGHLITIYLKEKLEDWLRKAKKSLQDEINKKSNINNKGSNNKNKSFDFCSLADVKKILDKNPVKQISSSVENLLKTGRLITQTGLDLQQRAGFTVQAERLNFLRFISHFRAVHRGASFAGLRTTTVRKLLPESWGFLCPVHTPDGEPCGLLNHMTSNCRITSFFDSQGNIRDFKKIRKTILSVLIAVGMTPSLPKLVQAGPPEVLSVLLDGRVVGSLPSSMVEKVVGHLRRLKISANSMIANDLEVGYVPLSLGGAYPGLYLFTSPARFVRPVRNISIPSEESQNIELIGPFEQVFMEIRCPDGGDGGRRNAFPATHEEIHPTGMLSVVANLTPWSDHNQSPRNMYQCQMAKQTMAFSSQAINFRADQKLYHLQTPQSPIVRTSSYTKYGIDEYPSGTNAIVAVLAYTGYDMEDAMILNKSSVERGMCRGQIYQTETIDLTEQSSRSDHSQKIFRRSNVNKSMHSTIDSDGLPYVGQTIQQNQPYYCTYDEVTSTTRPYNRKGSEPVVVDYVALDGKNKEHPRKANIRFRHPRNPVIGDKFSSRHGQKGVCSQLWPDIDMPFSGVTGMRPDLIINPHAFPSRMTIAMLLESVAAKGGSLHGYFVDATPFTIPVKKDNGDSKPKTSSLEETDGKTESKPNSLVEELGEMLKIKGFNYHGVEVLYSGVYGTELTCEIFIGPVYYQRLRHMVSDKYQVRSTGTIDQVTRQPIKGRKRGGGIRFGEMERDSMLAHGAAYLLHDRLHTCSDYHIADVCTLCGSILATTSIQQQKQIQKPKKFGGLPPARPPKKVICHACQSSKGMETVAMPYVFRYLAAELAAMNIKMTLQLSNAAGHTLNMLSFDVTKKCLVAEGWCPIFATSQIQNALQRATFDGNSQIGAIFQVLHTKESPPTYFRTNKFTSPFQEIVDAYGVAKYQEANPGVYTIITFPFLFAVMFGDWGHGICLLLATLYFIIREKKLSSQKLGDIIEMTFGGRYVILMMALFSIYTGLIYNEFFSVPFELFGPSAYGCRNPSCSDAYTVGLIKVHNTYPFGVDPKWHGSRSELPFLNSLKMKMSILLGVAQMNLGIILSYFNAKFYGDDINIRYQFVPQMIFLNSLFGYLSLLIIVKWCTGSQADLYHVMIYMFLSPTDDLGENQLFVGQKFLQLLLLLSALVAVPWMLFPKPFLLKKQNEERHQGKSYALLHSIDDPLEMESHHDSHGDEEFEFSEVFVHQLIHTIEFVLGAVSNTASYLRLWALSLAHSELSSVFYDKVLLLAWGFNNVIVLIIGIIVFVFATVGVLLVMETLSAFLHALRLHWVEFQNKFYQGDGYKFHPFSFALLGEEDE